MPNATTLLSVALWVEGRTSDRGVGGLTAMWALLRNNLRQVVHTPVPL